jgi:hypothetical protein
MGSRTQDIIIRQHTGRRVIICKEARTYLNPRVSHILLFIASMSTLSLIQS